jgi:hypothetical protein
VGKSFFGSCWIAVEVITENNSQKSQEIVIAATITEMTSRGMLLDHCQKSNNHIIASFRLWPCLRERFRAFSHAIMRSSDPNLQ